MARHIQYEDLALSIEPAQDGNLRVRILSSPYGIATEPFALPLGRPELEAMIREVGDGLFRCSNSRSPLPTRKLLLEPELPTGEIFRETGARLFQALFQGAVREAYLWSRARADAFPDRGLRLRIVLPADTEDAALLQSLPWELLYREEARDFLSRNVLTPVVRQLALPRVSAAFPETLAPRLRILIAVAGPAGAPPLQEAAERAHILEAWSRHRNVEVRTLLSATLRGFSEAVRSDHYQVIHFIAHGSFDPDSGVGSLLLETPEGEVHSVSGDVLAETLRPNRELRLVFLNSCESAQIGHRSGQDPLLGLAAALVARGVPAVIAMQFPISDRAARTFSEAVYRSLARGSSLEAAVADGRFSMYQKAPEAWEWITPALFTALSDTQVFRPLCPAEENRTAPTPESTLPREPYQRLCGRETWLGTILEQLRDPGGSPVIAIQGMGGIGKTALAHAVVRRSLREGLFTHALWLQATRPGMAWTDLAVAPPTSLTFEEVLDRILWHCGWTDGVEGRIEEKIRRATTLLQARRSILVLDNMETSQEAQEEIVHRLLPILTAAPVRLIVTSRKRFEHLVFPVALEGLGAGGARELLLMEAELRKVPAVYRASQKDLDRIADKVGGSPLALKLVVGQLQFLPIQVVLDRLRDVRFRPDGEEPGDEYEKFYRHLFWASWKLLESNEDSRETLLLLSYYEPLQGIPWSRLLEISNLREEPKRFNNAIESLWKLSLIEIGPPDERNDVRYYLHPLTQYFVESMESSWEAMRWT